MPSGTVGPAQVSRPSSHGGSPQIALVVQSPATQKLTSPPMQKLTPTLPRLQATSSTATTTAATTIQAASPAQQTAVSAAPIEDDLFFELPPPVVGLDEEKGESALAASAARWSSVQSEDGSDADDLDVKDVSSKDDSMVRSPCGTRWVDASSQYSLDRSYAIWFQHAQHAKKRPKSEQQYQEGLQCIGQFESVQDFWRYWNAIDLGKMPNFCSLSVFRHPIKPMWEDPHNKEGGQWVIRCVDRVQTSDCFTKLALALIGGYFECHEDLCGVVLSMKPKFNSLSLWNCQVEKDLIEPVEDELRELLSVETGDSLTVEYKDHGGTMLTNCIKRREVQDPASAAEAPQRLAGPTSLLSGGLEPARLAPSWIVRPSKPAVAAAPSSAAPAAAAATTNEARPAARLVPAPKVASGSSGSALKANAAPFNYSGGYSYSGYTAGATADYQYAEGQANYYSGEYAYYGSGEYEPSAAYYSVGQNAANEWA